MSAIMASRKKAAERKARRKAKAARIGTKAHAAQSLKAAIRKLTPELHRAIRERDGAVCFSCGKVPLSGRDWNAGHLFAVGAFPSVRFHPRNIHSQCVGCNMGKSGNHAAYSARFVMRYGPDAFERLYRAARRPQQWTAQQLQTLREALARGLEDYERAYAFFAPEWTEEQAA